jgi:hypothetical protein
MKFILPLFIVCLLSLPGNAQCVGGSCKAQVRRPVRNLVQSVRTTTTVRSTYRSRRVGLFPRLRARRAHVRAVRWGR